MIWRGAAREGGGRSGFLIKYQMRSGQQKQIDSDGEFEAASNEIYTLDSRAQAASPKLPSRKHPRLKNLSEKHRLGLVLTPSTTESNYSLGAGKHIGGICSKVIRVGSATFKGNFESGSINTVDLIGVNTFRIGLDLESNSVRGNSWFYFSVEGVKGEAQFVVGGFTKRGSLYNEGMKLCVRECKQSSKWRRGGTQITYTRTSDHEEDAKRFELRFSYFFKSSEHSTVQFAYCFPYTVVQLHSLISQLQPHISISTLGKTYDGRSIPLLTVGNQSSNEVIFLSARVHPGESGSSFIMEGFLKELVSNNQHAVYLRSRYQFKIVPMLNIDGVVRGNGRFSASGMDLNRKWQQPSEQHHPEIHAFKHLMLKQSRDRKIAMYIDMHGHSRKRNVFFYGCCRNNQEDDYSKAKAFPYLMSQLHDAYSYEDCSFNIQREKEGTARITMWKELKIHQVYTLEASFCGSDQGNNYLEADFMKIGKKLCEGIGIYFYEPPVETNTSQTSKMTLFKAQILQDLANNPSLLNVGNEDTSGSDSQPQKGQILHKALKKDKSSKQSPRKNPNKLTPNFNMKSLPKYNSLKQKSEASITDEKEVMVKEKEIFEYLFEHPSQNLTANERRFINPVLGFKNVRVHSLSRNNNYQKQALIFNEENIVFPEEKQGEKNKTNLLLGWEGAQYRRVRKIAEQNWKKDSTNIGMEVRGIKGNRLEIEDKKSFVPRLIASTQQNAKNRRTTAEFFFKKPAKTEQKYTNPHDESNVLCRGRQIFF